MGFKLITEIQSRESNEKLYDEIHLQTFVLEVDGTKIFTQKTTHTNLSFRPKDLQYLFFKMLNRKSKDIFKKAKNNNNNKNSHKSEKTLFFIL